MADRPKIDIKVQVVGADGTVSDLEKVADAQDDVADAAAKAGDAADKASKKAEAGKSRWGRLVDGLKAGAGAAASASAGIAGMAATLNTDLSEANKLAVAGLQGLSGVLGAFGPLGQLAATGVSLAAAALATFGDDANDAKVSGEGFLEKALKPMIEAFKTTEEAANEAAGAIRRVGIAASDDRSLFSPAEMVARTMATNTYNLKLKEFTQVYEQAAAMEKAIAEERARAGAATVVSARQTELDSLNAKASQLRDELAEDRYQLDQQRARAEKIGSGEGTGLAPAGPRKPVPVEFPAIQAGIRSTGLMLDNLLASFDRELGIAQDAVAKQTAFEADYYAAREAAAAAHAQYMSEQAAAPWEVMVREAEASRSAIDAMTAKVQDFGVAAGESFAAAAVASAIYGGSLMDAANQQLQAATVTAATEATIATAKGLGYLAAGVFGYGPGFAAAEAAFLSAATWGAIGLGTGLGAVATGGFGGGGAGGGPGLGGGGGGYAPDPFKPPQGFGARPYEDDRQTEITVNLSGGQGAPSRQQATAIIGALIDLARGAQIDLGGPFGPRGRR